MFSMNSIDFMIKYIIKNKFYRMALNYSMPGLIFIK